MSLLFVLVCDAAAIIDKSSSGDKPLIRFNNRHKAQFQEKTSVFVRNLPEDKTDDDLFQEFQKVGSVITCQVSFIRDYRGVILSLSSQTVSESVLSEYLLTILCCLYGSGSQRPSSQL